MDSKLPKHNLSGGEFKRQTAVELNKNPAKKFLGKTDNFSDNNERHFFQRMLKAYLKGQEFFHFGFYTNKIGERLPRPHEVLFSPKRTEKEVEAILQKGICIGGKVFGGMPIGKAQLRQQIKDRIEAKLNSEKAEQKKKSKTLAQKLGISK